MSQTSKPKKTKKNSSSKHTFTSSKHKSSSSLKRKSTTCPTRPTHPTHDSTLRPTQCLQSTPKKQKQNQEDIEIFTKKIVGEGEHHIWIHMVGRGNVTVDLVVQKMDELQDILDNMAKVACLQFTFVFDFRTLHDFADYSTIYKFGSFMKKNQDFFETRLRRSYLLLRYWSWRLTVKTLFSFFKPTKPVLYEIPTDVDQALCKN